VCARAQEGGCKWPQPKRIGRTASFRPELGHVVGAWTHGRRLLYARVRLAAGRGGVVSCLWP
jgi:hypothetical protein